MSLVKTRRRSSHRFLLLLIVVVAIASGFVWFHEDSKATTIKTASQTQAQTQSTPGGSPNEQQLGDTTATPAATQSSDQQQNQVSDSSEPEGMPQSLTPGTPMSFPTSATLAQEVEDLTSLTPGTFGIAVDNLTTGETYFQDADDTFTMASTYKVPLVLTSFELQEKGQLDPNASLGAGFTVDTGRPLIIERSEEDLAENLAAIMGWDKVQTVAGGLGMQNTFFDSRFSTTPRDMMTLLVAIDKTQGMDQYARDGIYNLMARQQINDRIPKYLPSGVIAAHKTGDLDEDGISVRHDIGIITMPGNQVYVIVLMGKDIGIPQDAIEVEAQLSYVFYKHFAQ